MKKLVIFKLLILLFAVYESNAQLQGHSRIDSLLAELPQSKNDTNKVKLLIDLSLTYFTINPYEGIEYGNEGLDLAKELNWSPGIARSYRALGVNYSGGLADDETALPYFLKSLEINEEIGDKEETAKTIGNIGIIYYNKRDFAQAIEYYQRALAINTEFNNQLAIANNISNIGHIYSDITDYVEAIKYYQQALTINEKIDNKIGIANNLISIGNIFSFQQEYNKALEYFRRSLRVSRSIGDRAGIAGALGSMANILIQQKEYEQALVYLFESLEISDQMGNLAQKAVTLGNIAIAYDNKEEYSEALEYYQLAIELHSEIEDFGGVARNLGNIGTMYLIMAEKDNNNTKFLNLAWEYLTRSINLYNVYEDIHSKSSFLFNLSRVYRLQGNFENSLISFMSASSLKDSIFNEETKLKIADLEAIRNNELKDRQIKLLKSEKKRKTLWIYISIGGVIVLIGALFIGVYHFKKIRKLNEKLSFRNKEIEEQKAIVQEKNEHILASVKYASTIQHAILPWDSVLESAFNDILIFYKPKDIVSGDSYWFKEIEGIKYLAVIDCTGHGIPGAMLTVIASSVLDDAVLGKRLTDTAEILTYMNEKVTDVLNQRLSENQTRDGMEVALIAIHQDKIQFTGAGRPLYLKNGTIKIIKTDKRGIAGSTKDDEYNFSSVEIERSESMTLYLTTDGFADQMNEHSKKYSTKRFVEFLDSISNIPVEQQLNALENELSAHSGNREQIDDITILGVKL